MLCQHLSFYRPAGNTWSVARCAAREAPYVPSLLDLEGFCRSGRHALCPSYLLAGLVPQGFAAKRPLAALAGELVEASERPALGALATGG